MDMKVSIICVYNNIEVYENQLCLSLANQTIPYELRGIDNTDGKFKSSASALNFGVKKAKGNVLIFAHQDIWIKDKVGLEKLACAIENTPAGSIWGVAGAKECLKYNLGNYTSGEKLDEKLIKRIGEPMQVSCVDELLFGMLKETYSWHFFDETICNNWHLYAVEMCLFHRRNGGTVFLCPIEIHHFSQGRISKEYMDNLRCLCDEYRDSFKYIWTTCYKVRTNWLYINFLRWAWIFNRMIKRLLTR